MASIMVPQESPSLALSSKDPYSTSAKLSFQFIFARKCPFDSQRVRAQRRLQGEDDGAAGHQGSNCGSAATRAVGCAVGGLRVPEGMFTEVNKGISATKQGGPREKAEVW